MFRVGLQSPLIAKLVYIPCKRRGSIQFKVVAIEAPDAASGRRGVTSDEVVVENAVSRYLTIAGTASAELI